MCGCLVGMLAVVMASPMPMKAYPASSGFVRSGGSGYVLIGCRGSGLHADAVQLGHEAVDDDRHSGAVAESAEQGVDHDGQDRPDAGDQCEVAGGSVNADQVVSPESQDTRSGARNSRDPPV